MRLSADGRELARNNGSVIVTIAVVNPTDLWQSHKERHLHTLALLEGEERYDHVAELLSPINTFIEDLKVSGLRLDGDRHPKAITSIKL